jgi:tungstate transport system substrate-binding protein
MDKLKEAFRIENGAVVRCIKTPTGPGLDLGRHGLSHITIGHQKEATEKFIKEGNAIKKAALMHNYTIIVGPVSDPANISSLADLYEAHKRISRSRSPYLSRGDGGGMHILEPNIWKKLNIDPQEQNWYKASNSFMLDSLMNADSNKQYHMLDSSTWTLHKSKIKNLGLFVTGPSNEYEICLVSAAKHANLKYNQDLAEQFYEFLIGSDGQKIIAEFGIEQYGEPVYYPDAIKGSR